ncbi:TIGR04423 family type III CRISPR-associated protein [Algoriphagus formosus]|uniref:TIGR04423 family type III CRISPR-associated protein n=1 Tax=Algoriphagus formosus TaxID=2007308 RepID=UPI000C286F4E|nr:TIGR04423 family type III CRISPR-associated protein [Algoriphagus formosus]
MKKIDISAIDLNLEYEGYLWQSDSKKPLILKNSKVPQDIFTNLPFVIEGYLFCASQNGLSIKISHFDGAYHVFAVELNQISNDRLTSNSFVARNFDQDIKFINSVQFWESVPDELCENMSVLEPAWVAFSGFN